MYFSFNELKDQSIEVEKMCIIDSKHSPESKELDQLAYPRAFWSESSVCAVYIKIVQTLKTSQMHVDFGLCCSNFCKAILVAQEIVDVDMRRKKVV